MRNSDCSIPRRAVVVPAILATLLVFAAAKAQQTPDTRVQDHIAVTPADVAAAGEVKFSSRHVMAASVPGARQKAIALNSANARQVAQALGRAVEPVAAATTWTNPHLYPADVQRGGGKTVVTAVNHAIYVNAKGTIEANWGNPEGYLANVFADPFIHLTDQYTKSTTDGRYTVGKNMSTTYTFYGNELEEHELWAIAHAAAVKDGAGLGNIYHIFLPNGIDTCIEETGDCYSPDNFLAWTFCAYHDYVQFKDIGVVIFTVEPYQATDGCAVHTPSPNGKLVDSTDSTLTHELFEAITDPEPDSGFTNQSSIDLQGYEVSDECQPLTDDNDDWLVPTVTVNGKKYAVQLVYSNTYHACAAQP